MIIKQNLHTFHIPVMGTGYTIDTPLYVAPYGISSVISIIDHRLIEQMREFHCIENNIPYTVIDDSDSDSRANQITAYLNLLYDLIEKRFLTIKNQSFEDNNELTKYFEMLPDSSELKKDYLKMKQNNDFSNAQHLKDSMSIGSIDVNIMTKLDRDNFSKSNEKLDVEFNDAHAALRGYAKSKLYSSLILSAGLNPRLFAYLSSFDCFYPNEDGFIEKKIVLKVSDYRSALVQGKMLAKKGIWVSEFRIESGLNCGGHAFATDGFLLGPIMEEFKKNRNDLEKDLYDILSIALKGKNINLSKAPEMKITVQGGVGTFQEHCLLMEYYNVDSVGWGSPFLLVPEVVNINEETMNLIANADESQFYMSNVSPLGVLFNTVKGTSGEIEKRKRIQEEKPGAICFKKHLTFNTEYTDRTICVASKQYQEIKIKELQSKNLEKTEFDKQYEKIVDKLCLCVGLGNATALKNKLKMYKGIDGVAVCPGPNMAYFSKILSLKEMVQHIYGKTNIIQRNDRPHMFMKELSLYITYLSNKLEESIKPLSESQIKYFQTFIKNLNDGILYYKELFKKFNIEIDTFTKKILLELANLQLQLNALVII